MNSITPEELAEKIRVKRVFLLDVRDPDEFEEAHIKGSANLTLSSVIAGVADGKLPRKKLIVCVCGQGLNRSPEAQRELTARGFNAVFLKGGLAGFTPLFPKLVASGE